MDEYNLGYLAKKNINILGVTPDGEDRWVVVYEYQWRRDGRPVWSKDYVRVDRLDDNVRGTIADVVLATRKKLENGQEE